MFFRLLTVGLLLNGLVYGLESSRARQNFFCDELLNKQIEKEFDAAQNYLSIASYFAHDRVALEGFAKKFQSSWKEELEHGQKLIDYGLTRGAHVETPSIPKPNDRKWETMTPCQIIEHALNMEKSVNEHLLEVHKCGDGDVNKRADPQMQDFLEANYLNEQVEANKELSDLLTRMERATAHVNPETGKKVVTCDGLGLYLIDEELVKKYSK